MHGFEYPTEAHKRKHGPEGYKKYRDYREWLRDEFTFRCVYCLHREKWYGRQGTFHIEHFVPISADSNKKCEYTNLFYSCATCNTAKDTDQTLIDPCLVPYADCLLIEASGEVKAINDEGRILCDVLKLNDKKNVEHRLKWMSIISVLQASGSELYQEIMGFPDDLTDLRTPPMSVPRNSKPEGAENCYFALRERGELPETF